MRINRDQVIISRWATTLGYHLRRGRGHLARYAWNRFRWHVGPRLRWAGRFPDHVDIETSCLCDMHCPMCYTNLPEFKRVTPVKLMPAALFDQLVTEAGAAGCYSIRLSLRGEPFMHPELIDLIALAKRRGLREVSTLTNGLKLDPDRFVAAAEAGLDWLTISFDGLGETYNRIRAPATFDEAVEKIREYWRIKLRRGWTKPVIKVQAVWPSIADDPDAFFDLFEPIVDQVASNPLVDYLHKDDRIEFEPSFTCPVLWQRLCVYADGMVALCSNDEFLKEPLGDATVQTLREIWHGPAIRRARAIHRAHRGVEALACCRQCYLPRKVAPQIARIADRTLTVENLAGRAQRVGA